MCPGPSALSPRILLAADVVAPGAYHRDFRDQAAIRPRMYENLRDAFVISGLPWAHCYREDRGGGVLLVAPRAAPAGRYLDPFLCRLRAVLRDGDGHSGSPLRLRVALHFGAVHFDAYGVTGAASLLPFRLLEAPAFKEATRAAGDDLAAIVSDSLFGDARRCHEPVDRRSYRQAVVGRGDTPHARAWLWCPPGRGEAGRDRPEGGRRPRPAARERSLAGGCC